MISFHQITVHCVFFGVCLILCVCVCVCVCVCLFLLNFFWLYRTANFLGHQKEPSSPCLGCETHRFWCWTLVKDRTFAGAKLDGSPKKAWPATAEDIPRYGLN